MSEWHLAVDGDWSFFKAAFASKDDLIENLGRILYGNTVALSGIFSISFGELELDQEISTPEGFEWTLVIGDRTPPKIVTFKTKHALFGFIVAELTRGVPQMQFARRS